MADDTARCVGWGNKPCPYQRYRRQRSPRCSYCAKKQAHARKRDADLRHKYGITLEEHDAILEAQGGVCWICGGGTSKRWFQVDHNHKTGEVRGLLCANCNRRLLPAAKDSIDLLYRAIDYLAHPPARRVLEERDWSGFAD